MEYKFYFIFLLVLAISTGSGCSSIVEYGTCPTWHHLDQYGKCKCGSRLGGEVVCERYKRVRLNIRYCMTYDDTINATVAGICPFSRLNKSDEFYVQQPVNVNELQNFTCGRLKRRGLLCSHCEDSLGIAVLSYSYECTKCLGKFYGWLLYFALAFVPITIFFLIVVFCNIRATAPHMNGAICVIQTILYDINAHFSLSDHQRHLPKAFLTIVGIWNLDFFRYIYPPFCISIHFSTLQVLAFEYIIAFYPLLLIIIAYICIELYDKNYRVIVLMWKPFSWCLSRAQKLFSFKLETVKYYIINTFASFLVFSYSKILFTCYSFLNLTQVFNTDGSLYQNGTSTYFSVYNTSVSYLGPQHKPYFILAIAILTLFNILPMFLLFAYPTKIFQKTLNCFPRVQWHFLHVFMDSFQGCYKNGTNNTRDYRYFAGIYLLIRLVNNVPNFFDSHYTVAIHFLTPLVVSLLFGVLRPYRKDKFNRLDCAYFGLYALINIWSDTGKYVNHHPSVIVIYVISLIPVVHTLCIFSYHTQLFFTH